jgi:MFS family permease
MAEFTTPDSIAKIEQLVPACLTSSELRPAPEEHDSKTTAAIPLVPDVSKAYPLRNADFRFLWIGSTISAFGDQFYFVGLSWLVLLFNGSGLVLGTVLMLEAVPRAAFMLVGGAVTDRISPKKVLIATAAGRMLLVAATAALIYLHRLHLWHLYGLALAFGTADAFAMPAGQVLVPALLNGEQLPAGNGLLNSGAQTAAIAGPAPAGLILKIGSVASVFVIDAVGFFLVILALWRVKNVLSAPASDSSDGIWKVILEGWRYVMKDPPMRSLMFLIIVLNLCVGGPFTIGLAVISKQRYGSAAAFGMLLSSLAVGSLLGSLLPALIKFHYRRGLIVLSFGAVIGAEMIAMGLLHSFIIIMVLLAILGFGSGLTAVCFQSWLQARINRNFLGRVMSIFMFATFGLLPISYAIAGALAQAKLSLMFIGSGALVLAATVAAALDKQIRAID